MYSDLKYADIQTVMKFGKCVICNYVGNYNWTLDGVCLATCESCGVDSCDIKAINK